MTGDVQIHYQFHSIRFSSTEKGKLALTSGKLTAMGETSLFGLALAPKSNGEWLLKDTRSTGNMRKFLGNPAVLQSMVNQAARLLKTINMWPGKSSEKGGAQIVLNEQLAPPEANGKVVISFRPDMLSLPTSNWADLWRMIEGRVDGDDYFMVHGFSKNEITMAIDQLKPLFHGDWVRARYRHAIQGKRPLTMAADFPPASGNWFPSYHLARTALGAICIDPGWNYLVEIGLSIRELLGFVGLEKLKKELVRSPGTQHHLCLAAELYRKGRLVALEPGTGSGNSTNDLLAKAGDREYHIEVKEFSSKEPGKQLGRELERKNRALPTKPKRPVVFHAVLVENGFFDKEKEERFVKEIRERADRIPPKISAVVAGRRFVDSFGGRIKRDSETQVLNPTALVPCEHHALSELFEKNYSEIRYPIFGIGSFFYFERKSTQKASS